jgi:hypothetical protein
LQAATAGSSCDRHQLLDFRLLHPGARWVQAAQLANLGDRLVFANGIILLGVFSAILIAAFGGDTHRLIPLYAVGVFVSFTLSQAGMVVHWCRSQEGCYSLKAAVNAVVALATGVVLVVVAVEKFRGGAFIVLILIPLLVLGFRAVNAHYRRLAESLALDGATMPRAVRHAVIVLVPGVHRGILDALAYAKALSPEAEAVFVEVDPNETPKVRALAASDRRRWWYCPPRAPHGR